MLTEAQAARRVKARKYMGDDAYSYALFVDGRVTYTGMDRTEAQWRRKRAIRNLVMGRAWNQ